MPVLPGKGSDRAEVPMPLEMVCAPARFYKIVDGDTFDLLVNFRRRRSWREATVVYVRLRGYGARESTGSLKNEAEIDPATGTIIRVSGIEAKRIATDVLTRAESVLVEFNGDVSEGRDVADVYVRLPGDTMRHLGQVLLGLHAVIPSRTKGLDPSG